MLPDCEREPPLISFKSRDYGEEEDPSSCLYQTPTQLRSISVDSPPTNSGLILPSLRQPCTDKKEDEDERSLMMSHKMVSSFTCNATVTPSQLEGKIDSFTQGSLGSTGQCSWGLESLLSSRKLCKIDISSKN